MSVDVTNGPAMAGARRFAADMAYERWALRAEDTGLLAEALRLCLRALPDACPGAETAAAHDRLAELYVERFALVADWTLTEPLRSAVHHRRLAVEAAQAAGPAGAGEAAGPWPGTAPLRRDYACLLGLLGRAEDDAGPVREAIAEYVRAATEALAAAAGGGTGGGPTPALTPAPRLAADPRWWDALAETVYARCWLWTARQDQAQLPAIRADLAVLLAADLTGGTDRVGGPDAADRTGGPDTADRPRGADRADRTGAAGDPGGQERAAEPDRSAEPDRPGGADADAADDAAARAYERLSPDYLDLFGRALYAAVAGTENDDAREHALAMLRHALAGWQAERDGDPTAAGTALALFQMSRYVDDQEPARLADIALGAATALASPAVAPRDRTTMEAVARIARGEQARLGLAEPLTAEEVRGFDTAAFLDSLDEPPEMDESSRTALERELGGVQRAGDGFELAHRRWLALPPGLERDAGAALLLFQLLQADPEGSRVTEDQIEDLRQAAVAGFADQPAVATSMNGLAARALALRGAAAGAGRTLQRAVELVEEMERSAGSDPDLRDAAALARASVGHLRGQHLGTGDDMDIALANWQRVRDSPLIDQTDKRLLTVQFACYGVHKAVRDRDLAAAGACLDEAVEAFAGVTPDAYSAAEAWTLLEIAWLQLTNAAEATGDAVRPLPPGRPTAAALRTMARRLPNDHRAWVLGENGIMRYAQGMRRKNAAVMGEGAALLRDALALCRENTDTWLRYQQSLGLTHCARAVLAQDPAALDEGIEVLERAFGTLPGPEHRLWAISGRALASAYRLRSRARGRRTVREDRARSRELGLDALRGWTWAALLQSGTGHAAQAAAQAGDLAMEVAGWCLEDGVPQDAVRALDACRGLLLHAAVTSRAVPERLAAAGRLDLAEQWRRATAGDGPGGAAEDAAAPGGPPGPGSPGGGFGTGSGYGTGGVGGAGGGDDLDGIGPAGASSDLRRRVLDALASADEQAAAVLLDPPGVREIGAALTAIGADSLVYLLPGDGERGGAAVAVTADGRVHHLPLPLLTESAGPIRDYRPVRDGRDLGPVLGPAGFGSAGFGWGSGAWAAGAGPGAPPYGTRSLREQLDRLAVWAWYAAMRPLLDAHDVPRRTPSIVLVPMGGLDVVPWHAAWQPLPDGGRRHALHQAAVSYAPSARQLCEVAARPALPSSGAALVVGNPTGDLWAAGEEAEAVRSAFYPDGVFASAEATPAFVLAWLRDPARRAGVLHLACHGTVDAHRRHSAYLALRGGRLAAEELTEDIGGGPLPPLELVVLAACRSNVSGRGSNEAFTLATAFLTTGACAVVGSLWPVPDDSTSVLMFMFHHYLRHCGQSPGRALRSAQLWVLDPEREIPAAMPPALRDRARSVNPHDLSGWAGFTHLGR